MPVRHCSAALVEWFRVPETLPAPTAPGSGEKPEAALSAGIGIVVRVGRFRALVGLTFLGRPLALARQTRSVRDAAGA